MRMGSPFVHTRATILGKQRCVWIRGGLAGRAEQWEEIAVGQQQMARGNVFGQKFDHGVRR